MKKIIPLLLAVMLCVVCVACGPRNYTLNENTFFITMKNIQNRPSLYKDSTLDFDCFTYELTDVNGTVYMCGVRKCAAGFGCQCGKDTIIGFVLESTDELPAPRNQSEDTNDKTWIHLSGKLKSTEKITIEIHSYLEYGSVNPNATETIYFLVFVVESCELIQDYSHLNYYVFN